MCPCHFFLSSEGVKAVLVVEGSSLRPQQHSGSLNNLEECAAFDTTSANG